MIIGSKCLFTIQENKLLNINGKNIKVACDSVAKSYKELDLVQAVLSSEKFNSEDFSETIFDLICFTIPEISKYAICNLTNDENINKKLKTVYEVYIENNLSEENKNIIKDITMKSFYNIFISDEKQKEILDKLSKDSKFNESMFDLSFEINDNISNIEDIIKSLKENSRNFKPIKFYTIFEPLLKLKEFTEEDLEETIYSYLIENHSRSNIE